MPDPHPLRAALCGPYDPFAYTPSRMAERDSNGVLSPQGWNADSRVFSQLITERTPALIFEIGTWKGASAIRMARLAPAAHIICIDTWLGSAEYWTDPNLAAFRADLPYIYNIFRANIIASGFASRITPLRLDSGSAATVLAHLGARPDLIYIDAGHAAHSVCADIINYSRFESALIFGDDWNWPSVREGVELAQNLLKFRLEICDEKWILRRN